MSARCITSSENSVATASSVQSENTFFLSSYCVSAYICLVIAHDRGKYIINTNTNLMEANGMTMGLTPYEQVKIGYMQSKKASGVAIGGLVTAVGAAVLAVGAGAWAGSQAKNAKDVAIAKNDGLRDLVTTLATTVAAERNERIAGDLNITTTINDTVQGSQSGQLTATQQAELSQAQQLMFGLSTGEYSRNPQKVALYQDAQPCPCPCGCNG